MTTDGVYEPPIFVPPEQGDLPGLPDWVPPDDGQPPASDLNDLSQFRRQVVVAQNTAIPTCYGRDRFFGAIFVLHVDDTAGFMYVAYAFCKGEIEAFETVYMDGVDITDAEGFLSFAGTDSEEYLGTTSQTASPILSAAIAGFTDAYVDLAYLVFKVPVGASQGFPRVEAIIQGKKLYDPRKDSTSSVYDASLGTSTHRLATPSTWEYTTNPSLAFYDFAREFTSWDLALVDMAANADYNDVLLGGFPRREIGLTLLRPALTSKWTKAFRMYCGCFFTWEAGELRMITERADVEAPGAVVFDGTAGTWIDVGDQPELDFIATDDFTVEARFKGEAGNAIVCKKSLVGGVTVGYAVYISGSSLICRVSDGTNTVTDTVTGTFNDVGWHTVTMVIDQTAEEMTVTTDGTERTPVSISAVTLTLANTQTFRIGSNSGGTERLTGVVDEVRVWDDIRTTQEIADNLNSEIEDPASDASLVGYWKLNDGTGSVAADSSASGNDGTLAGASGFATGDLLLIPEGVVRHFTADDINNRGFQLRKKPSRNMPTEVQVEYTDASGKSWPIARQKAQASGVDAGTTPRRISKISLPGVHSASQAKRTAIERLNWFLSDLDCTLPVFDEGLEVQQGSVVAVTHPIGLTSKLFRVRGLTGASGRWVFDLAEYDPQIYSNAVISDPTYPDTQLGDPLNPPVVAGLTAVEEIYEKQNGGWGSRVRVSWTASTYPFLSQYRVEGIVGGVVVWQTFVGINEAISPGVEQLVSGVPVDYDVKVYIRSAFGEGAAADAEVSGGIQGKLAAPSNVPSPTVTRIGSDAARLAWGQAVDIDIWRYEVRQSTGAWVGGDVSWDAAVGSSIALIDDLNLLVEGLDTSTNYLWMIKAIDSVRNESAEAAYINLSLTDPTAVTVLNGFEIAGEVRLNWTAPEDSYVARYRITYDTYPTPTSEITLDIVDTLTFSTKDVPAGEYTFSIYSRDSAGNESATSADKVIEVTLDADAFLADEYEFTQAAGEYADGVLTNMVQYNLRTDTRDFYVTNDGAVFISSPSSFSDHTSDPLANYHADTTLGASSWLSETHDFGLLLTGNWLMTEDATALNGTITKQMELSADDATYDIFTGGSAKGEYRYARYRISTFNPPGDDTAFVKSPEVSLKVNVVPIEENGQSSSATSAPTVINLDREYTAVKEINVQPKNKADALMGIVDNIIVGPNTGLQCDGTNYLLGGDWPELDFGTGDFSLECWNKNNSSGLSSEFIIVKRLTAGWDFRTNNNLSEVSFYITDGTNAVTCTTTGDVFPDDGLMHHIAITVDRTADEVSIYVDTVEAGGSPFDISSVTGSLDSTGNVAMFSLAGSNIHSVGGVIDEMRVWSDVRTPAEIIANYNVELDMTQTQSNLVGYWRMNGTTSALLGAGTIDDAVAASTNDFTNTGAGDLTYIDMGSSSLVEKINSFDAYVFDIFGQQLLEEFQWNWKGV